MNRQQSYTGTPVARRASLPAQYPRQRGEVPDETEGYDDVWPPPAPRSALRYTTATQNPQVIIQGNRRYVLHHRPPAQHTTASREEEEPRQHRRVHWSLIFGIGMVVMLALWIGGNMLLTWWTITQDDWHYGRPRTFQTDAVVGHADSPAQPSHFIAINFNRHVEIIELPGGDSTKAKIYTGPVLAGTGQDLTPVTLSFKDINGDGKPDMLVSIMGQILVMINENGQFRPLKAGEHVTV